MGCITFRDSCFKKLFLSRYLPRFLPGCYLFRASYSLSSANSSRSATAVAASRSSASSSRSTTTAAAGHVTACSLSPESFRLFLLFSLSTFSLFSRATSTTATHSPRQSGCNLSRQGENYCANSTAFTRAIVQTNTSAMLLYKLRQRRGKKLNIRNRNKALQAKAQHTRENTQL